MYCIYESFYHRANGLQCTVNCFPEVLETPPLIGSVISVKHHGFHTTGRLKSPFFLQVKQHTSWDEISSLHDVAKQRHLFQQIAERLGIGMEGWYGVTKAQLEQHGGKTIVDNYYQG